MKGAISLELIILLVIVVAIVALFGKVILDTSLNATTSIKNKSTAAIEEALNSCIDDTDCSDGKSCINNRCQ